jgi:hypothetical protein
VQLLPQAAFAHNSLPSKSTGTLPFSANYGYEPRFSGTRNTYLPTEATAMATELNKLHEQLRSDLKFMNHMMARQANKKRSEGPDLRKGDKVYLWKRNIKTTRPSGKLDFLKIGPFEIEDRKGPVNLRLRLPVQRPSCHLRAS